MRSRVFALAAARLSLLLCMPIHGQTLPETPSAHLQTVIEEEEEEKDPIAILELGAATSWNLTGGAATFAPNLAAEITPIENWLELEAGVSPFYTRNSSEWDVDLLFKKPWTISRKAEFMLGIGPEWVRLRQNSRTTNSIAGELAGDFMFWPSGRHRFGWSRFGSGVEDRETSNNKSKDEMRGFFAPLRMTTFSSLPLLPGREGGWLCPSRPGSYRGGMPMSRPALMPTDC